MKIKILYLIENTTFGGGERSFLQLAEGLDKRNYEPVFVCSPGGKLEEKLKEIGIKFIPVDFSKRFNLKTFFQLRNIMKKENPQIVHSQGSRVNFYARIVAKISKIPFVVSTIAMLIEGYDVNIIKKIIYVILDRFTEKFVNKFIVVSELLKDKLIKKHHIVSEKITVIYNGIELDKYKPDKYDKLKIRKEFNIGPDILIIGTIGRLVYQKAQHIFIRAAKIILDKNPQIADKIKFFIVGEGEKKDELEKLAKMLGIEKQIIFMGFRSDIPEMLSIIDIFVLSSILEGQPITLLEAMAMAKPMVVTNIEGIDEVVIDNKNAIVVPPKDSNVLAEGIITLLKDNNKAQQLGQNARKTIEQKFSIQKTIMAHEQLYQNCLNFV